MGNFSKKGKAVVFTAAATGATFAATMFAPMSLVFADTTATGNDSRRLNRSSR